MSDSHLHRRVYEALRSQIAAGEFEVNQKLPSEKELTNTFGVSRITIMRALGDLQNDGYIWRKQGAGSYIKSPTDFKCRLGLLIPGLSQSNNESVFPTVQYEITRQASKLGWQVLLGDAEMPADSDASRRMPVEVARRLVAHGVNAVAFVPFGITQRGAAYNQNVLSIFESAKIPVALVGADIVEYPDRSNYDVIALDDEHAGFIMGEHLLAQGCRRFAFLGLANRSPSRTLRLAGLRASVARVKGTSLVEISWGKNGRESKEIPAAIEQKCCDAVVAENDETAALAIRFLLEAGVKIPSRVKVGGFDNAPISELLQVPITSVAQPSEGLASEVIAALRERIQTPSMVGRWIRLHGNLVCRKSSGR